MLENSITLFTDDKDVFADLIVGFYQYGNATERQGVEQMLLKLALRRQSRLGI